MGGSKGTKSPVSKRRSFPRPRPSFRLVKWDAAFVATFGNMQPLYLSSWSRIYGSISGANGNRCRRERYPRIEATTGIFVEIYGPRQGIQEIRSSPVPAFETDFTKPLPTALQNGEYGDVRLVMPRKIDFSRETRTRWPRSGSHLRNFVIMDIVMHTQPKSSMRWTKYGQVNADAY